jgi:O-antigen/teichoic acid export membrane protein
VIKPLRRVSGWLQDALFRRLLQNTGWLLSGSVVATALGLLSTVLKTQALGPELFGLLAVILAYVATVGRLATFQPWQALIKFGAEALEEERPQAFMGLVKLSLFLDIIGAVLGTLIAVAGIRIFAGWQGWDTEISYMAVFFSFSLLFNWSGTPTGILRLLDRFEMFTFQKVLTAVLGLLGVAIVFIMDGGLWGFLLVTLIAGVVGNLFLLLAGYLALKERQLLPNWGAPITNWRPFLSFSWWTYLSATLDLPVKQLDIIIVSAVVSLEATGIYKIIKQIAQLLGLLADPIYQAVYPQFATMVVNNKLASAAKYAAKIGITIFLVVGPVAFGLAASSVWWLDLVFGEGFSQGWLPLSIFLLFKAFSLAAIAIHPLFIAMGYVKKNTSILLVSNTLYLLSAYLLGLQFELVGISLAYGIALLIVLTSKYVVIRKGIDKSTQG